jgi:glutathione S-transferase
MTLKLYYHPLASFCWKALISLYENGTPIEPVLVDLGNPDSRAAFAKVWPIAKFPVIRDEHRGQTVAEATVVIEYLDAFYPGPTRFVPADAEQAWQVRMWDRVFDHHVNEQVGKIITDRIRPAGAGDAHGVEYARAQIREAYSVIDRELEGKRWAAGDAFSLADCAGAAALSYAVTLIPFAPEHRNLPGYLDRLVARPSFARVLKEAEPYFKFYPNDTKPRLP